MPTAGEKLRKLMARGKHFIAAEAYSALTGRIVERVGFEAAYLGGHACSAFHYAVPDNGVFSQIEQIEQAGRIAHAISIPLVADADTLGETVADAYHFTRRYVQAGIGGIHIEDEVNPKHSRHVNGLCSIEDMQCRIEAAVKGRGGSDLVIIARCDEMYTSERGGGGGGSIEEAVKRGLAYTEAGADALVFPLAGADGNRQIIPKMKKPVCTIGFNIPDTLFTLSTAWGWVSAAVNHLAMAQELMQTGSVASAAAAMNNFPDKYDLIDQNLFDDLIVEWCERTGRQTRTNHAP